jgi:C-terminal processing protease CtpA/Prc
MAIGPGANPSAYFYAQPVVVLCDSDCFSATDNFLGALQGQPNVTLLGLASGGGSGRMTRYTLPNTKLPITVCQMASFQANGDLFDGRGVAPDIVMEPKPTDHLVDNGDSQLEAALERLKKAK